MFEKKSPLHHLLKNVPQVGKLEWIGIRPQRKEPLKQLEYCDIASGGGLVGDHFSGSAKSKRQVTLIQKEHFPAIAGCLGLNEVIPEQLRRNLVVSGVNLLAFKNRQFRVGDAVLEMTGLCHPCSRMEEILGPGGYNAVRGHGGITASVVKEGRIEVGDSVTVFEE
ncbi:MOSC domain-containing protein [Alteromonadaceae bacterium M269]|nr:MOSC domain-containing protein [Alteromonadaceae bacterium M269]